MDKLNLFLDLDETIDPNIVLCAAGAIGRVIGISFSGNSFDNLNYVNSIPVFRGAVKPIVGGAATAGQPEFEAIARCIRDCGGPVTWISLAPLTTPAVLLSAWPELADCIERFILPVGWMGYAAPGSITQYRIDRDPYAAQILFDLRLHRRMLPGNLGEDPMQALVCAMKPDCFVWQNANVQIDLTGTVCPNATVVDMRGGWAACKRVGLPETDVAVGLADPDVYQQLLSVLGVDL